MKKINSLLLCAIFACCYTAFGQNTCTTPFPISSDVSHTFPLCTSTPNNDSSNDYGCMLYGDNVTWLYFQVCQAGSVDFNLSASGTSASDIDYIVYGPLSSISQCGLDSSYIVACGPASPSANIYLNVSPAGSYYKIMIANFINHPGTFTLQTMGGPLTAAIFDTICTCTIPPVAQAICQVTTKPTINRNVVIWNKDPAYIYDYTIQKETTTMGAYTTLATIMNNDTSAYEDTVSNPMIQSFKYRILTTDSCGQFTNGAPHTTIHLLTSPAIGTGYPQLAWNPYVGFGYGTYFIYRGSSASTLSLYDSISASFTTYTDVNPTTGISYYAIGVNPPIPCSPSRSLNAVSYSNVAPVMFVGIRENELSQLSLSPNPATNSLNISFGKALDASVELLDITGRRLLANNFSNTSVANLDLSTIANGYYIIKITSEKGSAQKRIIVSK